MVRSLSEYDDRSVRRSIRDLLRFGLLIPEGEARHRRSRVKAWKENLASAYYHVASRDIRFIKSPAAIDHFLRARVAAGQQPRRFKRYREAPRLHLPPGSTPESAAGVEKVLAARRTVREFSRRSVALEDLGAIVRRTWGRTGWINGGVLGRLATKTSPSAGALHPIECYIIALNVRGVMTAVFERTLWKYQFESAYRVLWLDAGHLAQTFCLLATSRGLGPFTTAAIQDSFIEKLIGLDGIREFPIYLCGAGLPANALVRSRASSRRRQPSGYASL